MDVVVTDAGEFLLEEAINEKGEDGRPLLTELTIKVLRSNWEKGKTKQAIF